jgi:hypothetical protein
MMNICLCITFMPFEVFQDPPEFDMRIIPFSHDPWGKKVSQNGGSPPEMWGVSSSARFGQSQVDRGGEERRLRLKHYS